VPLTSKQLLDLYATPSTSNGFRGRLQSLRRSAHPGGGRMADPDVALIDAISSALPNKATSPGYDSPIRPELAVGNARNPKPLTPSDLMWLERLPRDPADVSYEDARALSQLAHSTEPGSADARLMNSIYEPVRRLHAGRLAQVELARLEETPLPDVPANQAVAALAKAYLREIPVLTEDEAVGRAQTDYLEARDKARQGRAEKLDEARAAVAIAARTFNADDVAGSAAYERQAAHAARSGSHAARAALAAHAATRTG
jgi:hypothetical protein